MTLSLSAAIQVRKFRPNNRRLRVLSDKEEIELFAKLEDNDLIRNVTLFVLNTGLRRGEIFNLQVANGAVTVATGGHLGIALFDKTVISASTGEGVRIGAMPSSANKYYTYKP